jgi:predicted NAD/FAD-dependent oxidoreductase
MLFPSSISIPDPLRAQISDHLLALGRHYSVAINAMSSRTDTHDMGFIVQPALQKDWELTYNKESKKSVVNAAHALASRYDERVGAIRSWDVAINNRYSITDMKENFLVIIDSMCSKFFPNLPHTYNSTDPNTHTQISTSSTTPPT